MANSKKRTRSPIKFDLTKNYVRERLVEPTKCQKGSFLTVAHKNKPGHPKDVNIITCKLLGSGKRVPQAIAHTKSRFATRHPAVWDMLVKSPSGTVKMDEIRGLVSDPSYAGFGGMFGQDLDFNSQREIVDWALKSGWFQKQIDERAKKGRAKYLRAKQRKLERQAAERGMGEMSFKDNRSVMAFVSMLAPKGYEGMFGR